MTPAEAAELLTMCSAYDNRRVDEAGALAWQDALSDLPAADCQRAVRDHYRESSDRVMPADVRRRVRRIRADRIDATPTEQPPPGLTVVQYQDWLRDQRRRIADGWEPPRLPDRRQIELPDILPSP